jgi:antitoxin HicB
MKKESNKHIGSSFDDFLEEEGILEEVELVAIKRVIAYQMETLMKEQNLTQTEMAARMSTSRAALKRLLDPANPAVTLQTLQRAATVLGKRLRIELM